MRRVFRFVFSQRFGFKQWGAFKQSVGQVGIYLTLINTVMLMITCYNTRWIQENIVNVNFIGFSAVILALIFGFLLLAWKVDMPSFFKSWNEQFYKHDNKLVKDVAELQKSVDALTKAVKELGEIK